MDSSIIPMLSEHQAPISDLSSDKPTDYQPTDEERALTKKIDKMFERAKKHRKAYDENWLEYYQFFRGKQWKEQRPTYRHSEVINMVFQAIQSVVPIMTDAKPQLTFLPEEPGDMALAEILNHVSEHDWHKGNWLNTLTEVIYDGHFFGTGLSTCPYDKDCEEIKYESVDPFYCFPDPNAQDVNKKAKFFIHAEPMDLDLIKKKWPEKGKFVKSDLLDISKNDRTNLGEVRFKSPTDQKAIIESDQIQDQGDDTKALVITAYFEDESYEEKQEPMVDEQGNVVIDGMGIPQFLYSQILKYPKGRKVVIAGNVVLEDGELQYEDKKFPFSRYQNYILPREFWGISEVEQLKGPQKIFNKLVSYAMDVLTLMGNPIWIVDNTSGVDTDNLFNRPGLIVEKEPNSEVRREEGVQLQPYVLQLIDRMAMWFDDISGSNDVTQGKRPEGITAASAIQQLQDAAQTRIRQKSRNLDMYLQDFGQQYLSRVFQYYTVPRVVRISSNPQAQEFFKFHVESDENGKKYASIRKVGQSENGQTVEDIEALKFEVKGRFDVRVTTGSSLPFAKKERFAVAKELFQLAVIDEEELLKSADYPNWEAVLARVKEQKAQMANQQALQASSGQA